MILPAYNMIPLDKLKGPESVWQLLNDDTEDAEDEPKYTDKETLIYLQQDVEEAKKYLEQAIDEVHRFINYSDICLICKKKYGIKKYYHKYCSFNCMNDDHSTWTDYGDSDEESDEAEDVV
jgi:hypothetical protein